MEPKDYTTVSVEETRRTLNSSFGFEARGSSIIKHPTQIMPYMEMQPNSFL